MMHHSVNYNLHGSLRIWRYMSIEKFALLMSRRQLWFTRADLLGDEHEGSLPDSVINEREQRLHDHRVIEMIERGSKEGRRHDFISCWSMQAANDLRMWKIYTPHATGIAVKTTVDRLANCFVSIPDDHFEYLNARIEKINYIDYDSHTTNKDFDNLIHKQKGYVYEKEVRILIESMSTVEEPTMGKELEVDLGLLIDKI